MSDQPAVLLLILVLVFFFLFLLHLHRIPRPSPYCGHILGNSRTFLDYEQEPVQEEEED
jgi:hypothetical protein